MVKKGKRTKAQKKKGMLVQVDSDIYNQINLKHKNAAKKSGTPLSRNAFLVKAIIDHVLKGDCSKAG